MLALLLAVPLLVFHGNVGLVDDVYRTVLDLPTGTKATPPTARAVASRLQKFLHDSGYVLATVRARAEGDQIVVDIDEGGLDKIIFLGGGAFETLRLRLELNLRDGIFNKPELERQLRALGRRLGLGEFAYEVVPVAYVEPSGLQLGFEPTGQSSREFARLGRPYELHVLVQPGVLRPGISPELEVNSLEGGGLGATWQSGRLLYEQDRYRISGRVAGALRGRLDGSGSYFTVTRLRGDAEYDCPPIAGALRPSLRVGGDLIDRQRPDLRLEAFRFARLEAGLQLLFLPLPQLSASLGLGAERRLLFSVEPQSGVPPLAGPQYSLADTRPYADATLSLTFDPESIRRDQHHQLALGARLYAAPHTGDEGALHLFASYQKMWHAGWNELWLEARGISRTGFVVFPEEESIGGGDFLRGPFGAEYTRRLVAMDLEYRLSLYRDVFKVGLFHNAVAYSRLDRVSGAETLAAANAVGLGVHLLIIDEFQLDAGYGVGWASGGKFDSGGALAIQQAF
jgi:hypothetical protein